MPVTKRIIELLSSLKMTIAAGVFLAASLVLMLTKASIPVDPAWVTVIICGLPLLYSAVTDLIIEKTVSSALLITIAMIASVAIGELFAAGEIAFIMAIGEILEDKTVERAKKGIKKLIGLAPMQGRRIFGGNIEMVPVEQIKKDDVLRVLPGEAIPVDGEIVFGHSSVDQSVITGEALPVDKDIGDSVFCGTINRFGSVDIKATKVGEDSTLSKLIHMVRWLKARKRPFSALLTNGRDGLCRRLFL